MSKVWFITGVSRGFGRAWATAALQRGDRVAATARDIGALDDLQDEFGDLVLPLQLDVTDRDADFAAVVAAHAHFGRLDVVVNNAGYGHFGFAEETTEAEARQQIETNLFGAIWVTQAALPLLREQGSGHIVQVSSIGGVSTFPRVSLYNASKWALEGFSQSMAEEVADFGIKVTLVEPGGYATDWIGNSAKHSERLAAYDEVLAKIVVSDPARHGAPGDPRASAEALLTVVDSDNPPLRVIFGETAISIAKADYESRLALWDQWADLSRRAQG